MPPRPLLTHPNDVFGKLTILYRVSNSRNNHTRWMCRCECGMEKEILATHLVHAGVVSCGCDRPRGPTHKQWTGCGEIHGDFFGNIRRGANGAKGRAPLEFAITIEYVWGLFLKQERRCALSGVGIHFKDGNYNTKTRGQEITASLDRIDSGEGYVPGNVQWVHKDVNRMKGNMTEPWFLEWCRKVAATHPGGACEL
jgi:hypothetical protein